MRQARVMAHTFLSACFTVYEADSLCDLGTGGSVAGAAVGVEGLLRVAEVSFTAAAGLSSSPLVESS